MTAINIKAFENLKNDKLIKVLDLRHQDDFIKQHIPYSIFIGIDGPFDKWMQLLVPNKTTALLLMLPENKIDECLLKLKALGYTQILGYLEGGIQTWITAKKPIARINSIAAKTFVLKRKSEKLNSIDIRKTSEFETAHLKDTILLPLVIDKKFTENFNHNKEYHLFCGGGYRSVIAISYLQKHHIKNVVNIEGGFRGIQTAL